MTVRIGVACEDHGHFRVCTRLIDDALVRSHGWLHGVLEHCRAWCGIEAGSRWYKFDPEHARALPPITIQGVRIHRHGHIAGVPLKPEADMWRSVLMLFCRSEPRPDAVLLVRDLDGYAERLAGIDQIRAGYPWPFALVVATPQPEIEAWEITGHVPRSDAERQRLAAMSAQISFDPTTRSHRLTSHPNDAMTDAKRVLAGLGLDDEGRARCLDDHARLRQRGQGNHLAAFLDEIEARLVPLFGGAR